MKIVIAGKEFEVSEDAVKQGLESGSVSVDVSDVVLRTKEEDEQFQSNLKNEGTSLGIELGRKNVLKGLGIEELNGAYKSDDKAIELVNTFVQSNVEKAINDAKIEPNKKVQELQASLQQLQNTVKEKESAFNSLNEEFVGYKKNQKISSTLMNLIPENTVLDRSDMYTIITNKLRVDVDESGNIYALDNQGNPIKDELMNVKPIEQVVKGFFDQNPTYLKTTKGGGAGDDSSSSDGKQSLDSFTEEMRKQNINPGSQEFVSEMNNRIRSGLLEI